MKTMNEETAHFNNESNVKKFKITNAIDLINRVKTEPEPKIIWNGITEGSKGLIAGVSKTGKTTLAENLAISIAVRDGSGIIKNSARVSYTSTSESNVASLKQNTMGFSPFCSCSFFASVKISAINFF